MNYTSTLKGWAVDRVIELQKHNAAISGARTVDELLEDAQKLVDYTYSIEEDIAQSYARINELEARKEQIEALKLVPASNRGA
jgi:hypothetical protein